MRIASKFSVALALGLSAIGLISNAVHAAPAGVSKGDRGSIAERSKGGGKGGGGKDGGGGKSKPDPDKVRKLRAVHCSGVVTAFQKVEVDGITKANILESRQFSQGGEAVGTLEEVKNIVGGRIVDPIFAELLAKYPGTQYPRREVHSDGECVEKN